MSSHGLVAAAALAVLFSSGAAAAETFELVNGDIVSGDIVEQSEDLIVIESPSVGRIAIPTDQIVPPDPVNPGLFGTSFMQGWDRRIGAGISGSSGSSNNTDISAELLLRFENEHRREKIQLQYYFAQANGDRSKHEFSTELGHDILFEDSKFFVFTLARYDLDQFKSWSHRLSANAGGGFDIYRSDVTSVRGRLGVGFSREWDRRAMTPEGVAGLDWDWKITEGQTLAFTSNYYPDLEDFSEFRTLSEIGWNIAIPQMSGLSVHLGAGHEYETRVRRPRNDIKYKGSLNYSF